MNSMINKVLLSVAIGLSTMTTQAQEVAGDSVMQHVKGNKFSIGGYGEVAYSRNYYSDHVSRYSQPEQHKDDPSHGRFDIPHAVVYMGYDFGKGWTFGTEIEFEHGGAGIAYEKEDEEGGEWEQETEKGGEVANALVPSYLIGMIVLFLIGLVVISFFIRTFAAKITKQ